MPEPQATTTKATNTTTATAVKPTEAETKQTSQTQTITVDTAKQAQEVDIPDFNPLAIKYAKSENKGTEELDNGLTQITYFMFEPKQKVDDKNQTQTHVVKLKGKRRVSYDIYSGDEVSLENHLGSLDVSQTG